MLRVCPAVAGASQQRECASYLCNAGRGQASAFTIGGRGCDLTVTSVCVCTLCVVFCRKLCVLSIRSS